LVKKITHEIKIPRSIIVALYSILFVLTLNLVSPFFNVKTASAFSNEVHKIAICHPVHFTRCAEIKDGVLPNTITPQKIAIGNAMYSKGATTAASLIR